MSTRRIAEALDEPEDGDLGRGTCGEAAAVEKLALEVAKKFSQFAVSSASPAGAVEGWTPASSQRCPNARDVYRPPLSEW